MPTFIALLRAVNVGGNNRVAMADLRSLVADLGFSDPRTLLQSGNVVFGGKGKTAASIESLLERETAERLGVKTEYFVRTAAEWKSIVAQNPFPQAAVKDPGRLVVMPLKGVPTQAQLKTLAAAGRGREVFRAVGKQLYIVYPDGIGVSKLTNTVIERCLATRGTGRNWNTVVKLAAQLAT
jgi:uncharacterized protein (DUF1697 family)